LFNFGEEVKMKIVAIGGGEIGRPKKEGGRYPIETRKIDEEIIRLTGKRHPVALLLPTASGDSEIYYPTFEKYYGGVLGCKTDVLYLIKEKPSIAEMKKKLSQADIIYVGGGNTMRMLQIWKKAGLDKLLQQALNEGKVLSGVSAGAICWFKYGNSDSKKFGPKKSKELIKLKCLGYIPLMACPHYDSQPHRQTSLRRMIRDNGGSAIALGECTAMEIEDNQYRFVTSKKGAVAYRIYRTGKRVVQEPLELNGNFRPLEELI
jgi:dipeptidase E